MADPEAVSKLPRQLPDTVSIPTTEGLTPNEMRKLKEASGRRLDELFGEASDLDDKTQALVWVALHRQGFEASWDEAGDVRPEAETEVVPDPLSAGLSQSSPPSPTTGA